MNDPKSCLSPDVSPDSLSLQRCAANSLVLDVPLLLAGVACAGGSSLRRVKRLADRALGAISGELDALYSSVGRPSIPPERLLKAQLLIALYSVRSDQQFCEQLDYNILFRWFLDMDLRPDAGPVELAACANAWSPPTWPTLLR